MSSFLFLKINALEFHLFFLPLVSLRNITSDGNSITN